MSGASENGEVDAWPAFVDALANLVLALVFVLMVFTIALAYISTQVAAQQAAKQTEEIRTKVAECENDLLAEIAKLKALLAEAEKNRKVADPVKSAAAVVKPLAAKAVTLEDADLVVIFQPGAVDAGSEAVTKLDQLMKGKGANPQTKKFSLTAVPASGPFSQEKRLAYYRLVGLRNALIDFGVPIENIETTTDTRVNLPGLSGQVRLNVGTK